jgi:long-chain acyl-CoA synthetase
LSGWSVGLVSRGFSLFKRRRNEYFRQMDQVANETTRAGTGTKPSSNLYEHFRNAAKTHAHRPAFKESGGRGRTYTYAEVDRQVRQGASILGSIEEPLFALIGENRPEWPIAYLSIVAAGKTVVPIDCHLKANEIAAILRHSGVKTVLATEKCAAVILKLNLGLQILSLDSGAGRYWIDNAPTADNSARQAPSDEAVIIYTSGTTGDSKAVVLTHQNLLTNRYGISQALAFNQEDVFLSVLPLHHTFEASCGFLTPLFSGCCIVYARSLKSKEILEDLAANNVTIMCGVPLLFEKMYHTVRRGIHDASVLNRSVFWTLFGVSRFARLLGFKLGVSLFRSFRRKAGLQSIRMFVSGGAPLPRSVSRFFNLVGFEFLQGYGLTECSPVVSVNRPDDNRFGSVGPPLCNVKIRIDQPDQEGIGEICVQADSATSGYRGNPERTAELIRNGWLHTGDLGRLHKGHLWITGRAKNVIISAAGKNIYPEELEERLLESKYILEAVVNGRKKAGGRDAEEVCALIVPDLDQFKADFGMKTTAPDMERIRRTIGQVVNEVNAHIADFKRIVAFDICLSEFEKTSTKKVKRHLYSAKEKPGPS